MHGCPLARIGERDAGGMNVFLKETARELGRRGVSVDIFTRFHDPNDPQVVELGENARVIHLAAGPLAEPKQSLEQHLPAFAKELRGYVASHKLRYDVVHGHYWLSGPAALELAEAQGAPAIASFHTLARVQDLVRASSGDAPERAAVEERIAREADCWCHPARRSGSSCYACTERARSDAAWRRAGTMPRCSGPWTRSRHGGRWD